MEFGTVMRARSRTKQKQARRNISHSKIKFDQQIVAIAEVQGAKAIYSDDKSLRGFAEECGMESYSLSDIPIPAKQEKLF